MPGNYQKQLDKVISSLEKEGTRKRLLLHACCAPCASYVLEYLTKYFDITVFFYNPNIHPYEEYNKRLGELKRLLGLMPCCKNVELIEGSFNDDVFYNKVKGLEEQGEGGTRCRACIEMRLEETARTAMEGDFDYFCTTLSVSPHKNAAAINELSFALSGKYEIGFLPSDFKKREGYKRTIQICSQYAIYRQNYCGCLYSNI